MKLRIQLITENNGNLPIGTAYDVTTAISLVELAKLKGYTKVDLVGSIHDRMVSGEYTIQSAFNLILL